MMEPHDRLVLARIKAGHETAADAARVFGWSPITYRAHESGLRGLRRDAAARYAVAFNVSEAWLLTGEGGPDGQRPMVPVVGFVGAGAEVQMFDGDQSTEQIDEVDAPPASDEHTVAVIVRGDSMAPAFRDRDVIYYRNIRTDLDQLIGRECVIRLSDGRTFVKILMRGGGPGFFTLFSYNAPLISDVVVEWAVPVKWVMRD
jgi:phage repressor protein C with HTH and peptisase S24 domain